MVMDVDVCLISVHVAVIESYVKGIHP